MHILRPPTSPAPPAPAPSLTSAGAGAGPLPCRVRLADGRVFTGALPAARHRSLQLGLLHADTRRARRAHARHPPRRRAPRGRPPPPRPSTSCPAARAATRAGCAALLAHAERIVAGAYAAPRPGERPGEEVFVGVAPRTRAVRRAATRSPARAGCGSTSTGPTGSTRCGRSWPSGPCQLLIASGGSGGVHAYWQLAEPLPARWRGPDGRRDRADRARARPDHPRARRRRRRAAGRRRPALRRTLARDAPGRHHQPQVRRVGARARGRPRARAVRDRGARRRPARPAVRREPAARAAPRRARPRDPYKRIAPPEYFQRLAGISVPRGGLVSCPVPRHRDRHPSCSVGTSAEQGWCCHSAGCGARGAIYDLASVLDGGPWGPALRGEAFARAKALVIDVFGALASDTG